MLPKKRKPELTIEEKCIALKKEFPHDIQMYYTVPKAIIDLGQFKKLALERREILKMIELLLTRGDLKGIEERKTAFINLLRKDGYTYVKKLVEAQGCKANTEFELEARRRDVMSHFAIRLAYSQNNELRKWMINMETEYLKLRLTSLNREGMTALYQINNLNYEMVTEDEKTENHDALYKSTAKVSSITNTDFYKVPFTEVTDLIKSRKVFLKKGIAWIPQSDLSHLFISNFKRHLTNAFDTALEDFYGLQTDDRVYGFLKNLPNIFTKETVSWSNNERVPIEALDELAKTSYPLCMRTVHEGLKANNHLKNNGRVQYILFLKGIGVRLEDSIRFWQNEFTKKIDLVKFEKDYLYQIKFMYGKAGGMKNYTPMGCSKIISNGPGPGECHGCPYRHMDNEILKKKITGYGLSSSAVAEVSELAKGGHPQLACAKYFELTHRSPPEHPIMHPNTYFKDSRNIITKGISSSGTAENQAELSPARKSTAGKYTPVRTSLLPSRKKIEPMDIESLLNDDDDDVFDISS